MALALVFGMGVLADSHDDDHSVHLSPSFLWQGEKITQPVVGQALTAALVADDPTGITWQWARSEDGESGWGDIEDATATSYTPTEGDAGHYLRATSPLPMETATARVERRSRRTRLPERGVVYAAPLAIPSRYGRRRRPQTR